jgi:threonine synthase
MRVECSDCGAVADPLEICGCGGLPEFVLGDLRIDPAGLRRVLRERRASYEPLFASGVWRLREILPPIAASAIVSLNEGNIPLYVSRTGAAYAGVDRLAYVHLGMAPTGSFKDLGMTVAISAAVARGAKAVVCASTGNTASSMAAYASRAGLKSYAIVPRGRVADAKLGQMREYGAEIVEVDGSFDDAFASLNSMDGAMVVNSVNAYRIEGQKCAAFALLEARQWSVPDWVALPGGNLGNISAFSKGFREAKALGLIDRLPRIALIRAAAGVDTQASAIAVGDPKSIRRARRALADFNGVEHFLDDEAILDAKASIGREGIGCEPASAASLGGVRALRRSGAIDPGADVVAVLTGHVLKDVRARAYAAV